MRIPYGFMRHQGPPLIDLCNRAHTPPWAWSAGTAKVTVMADLLTQVGEHQVLCSGVISRYWFDDKTGELQVIVQEGAERLTAAFTGPPSTASPPLPISGHILALPVKDIKNFNIVYLTQ